VVNTHLLRDLTDLGLWNDELRQQIVSNNGSIQQCDLPQDIKEGIPFSLFFLIIFEIASNFFVLIWVVLCLQNIND
jgi:hypothetical protein